MKLLSTCFSLTAHPAQQDLQQCNYHMSLWHAETHMHTARAATSQPLLIIELLHSKTWVLKKMNWILAELWSLFISWLASPMDNMQRTIAYF